MTSIPPWRDYGPFVEKKMAIAKKVFFNTAVQIMGRVVMTICSLILVMILTRYLGVAGYGQYTTIFAFTGFFSTLADLGLYLITVREIAQRPNETSQIMGNVLGLRLTSALLMIILAGLVGLILPYDPVIKWGIIIAMCSIFLMTLNQTMIAVFQANLRIDKAVLGDILGRITILGVSIYLVSRHFGLLPIVAVSVLGALLNLLLTFILSFYYWRVRPLFNFKLWKKILQEALPLWIITILGMVYFKIDTILLSVLPLKVAQTNAFAVGIYGAPYKILEVLVTIPAMFAGAAFPILSSRAKEKDQALFQRAFSRSFEFMLLIVLPLSFCLFILAPYLIEILGGKDFASSILILQILTLTLVFIYLTSPLQHALIAKGQQRRLVVRNIIAVFVNIILNLALIPYLAAKGAAIATTITQGLILVLTWQIIAQSQKGLQLKIRRLPQLISAVLIICTLVYVIGKSGILHGLPLLPLVGIILLIAIAASIIYVILLVWFKVLSFTNIREVLPSSWRELR